MLTDRRFNNSTGEELFAAVKSERGIALIMVLIVLLLLSILGATIMTSTTSELRMTGNARNSEDAFFAADCALEFTETNGLVFQSIVPNLLDPAHSWPPPGEGNSYGGNYQTVTFAAANANGAMSTAHVKVDYVATGPVPPGMGAQVDSSLGGTGTWPTITSFR